MTTVATVLLNTSTTSSGIFDSNRLFPGVSATNSNGYGRKRGCRPWRGVKFIGSFSHLGIASIRDVDVMFGLVTRPAVPLLRVPPFPYARHRDLMRPGNRTGIELSDKQIDDIMESIASSRVGGTYWGEQPSLPNSPYTLVRIRDAKIRSKVLKSIEGDRPVLVWLHSRTGMSRPSSGRAKAVGGCCDPWHLINGAEEVYADADDDLALITRLMRIPLRCVGQARFQTLDQANFDHKVLRESFREHVVRPFSFLDPFSGARITLEKAVELCTYWRSLVDSNRDIQAALGFASWKRSTVAPLLWAGSSVPFASRPKRSSEGKRVAVWRSRVARETLTELERRGDRVTEVEDGFIRSVGLGADCVPPLSIVVDRLGIYFDPGRQSELERQLQEGGFSADVLSRAKRLREVIVELGISKYGSGGLAVEQPRSHRRSILVPGQVEDDRSILCGGGDVKSNLELLRRVRNNEPDAHIVYKPHPDVEAGHRVGAIPDELCLALVDEIVRDQPISTLLARVDEVHVNTSLAGFEALLRGKQVTTYGVPFYAGWGLTRDLGPVPSRRTARRTLDELVAAALLIYPRYIDPLSGIPCPPEVLIDRLSRDPGVQGQGFLVPLRRLQGQLKRQLSTFRSKLA